MVQDSGVYEQADQGTSPLSATKLYMSRGGRMKIETQGSGLPIKVSNLKSLGSAEDGNTGD